MPALNFKAQFADAVERREKRQTIRAPRKDGRDPKPGDVLHLYTGMHTKACRRLGAGICLEVTPVTITETDIRYDGAWLGPDALYNFAKADGFTGTEELAKWFEKVHGLPFHGLMIRWE